MARRNRTAIVVEGDIQRRLLRYYIPDFYKDSAELSRMSDILWSSAAVLDYLLEKSLALPSLESIYDVPADFLPSLAKLLGYKWRTDWDAEDQRHEIAKLVDVYKIRGTEPSVIRLVLHAGAFVAEVFTPFEHIFTLDRSLLSGGDRFEDLNFWRWGTYEIVSDAPFSRFKDDIADVHPAGTKWFGRYLLQLEDEDPPDPNAEVDPTTIITHVVDDDYRQDGADNDSETVLLSPSAEGYWELNEAENLVPSIGSNVNSQYGFALYGSGVYGSGPQGYFALDSSGNNLHGRYNSEIENIAIGNGIISEYGPIILPEFPIIPGSVYITSEDQTVHDNGNGILSGNGSGTVEYETGELNFIFNRPPGSLIASLPPVSTSNIFVPTVDTKCWLSKDLLSGLLNDQLVSLWEDSYTSNNDASQTTALQTPTYVTNGIIGLPSVDFVIGNVLMLPTALNLGTVNTIHIVFQLRSLSGVVTFLGDDVSQSELSIDLSTKTFKYKASNNASGGTKISNLVANRRYVLSINRNGTSVGFYLNGVLVGNSNGSALSSNNNFIVRYIGAYNAAGTNGFDGLISEVILVDSVTAALTPFISYVGKAYALPTYAKFWMKSDAIIGLINNSDVNSEFFDISPTMLAVSQSDAARRPLYLTNMIGTKPAVYFRGVAPSSNYDGLNLSSPLNLGVKQTIFVLFSPATVIANGTNSTIIGYDDTTNCELRYVKDTVSKLELVVDSVANKVFSVTLVNGALLQGVIYSIIIHRNEQTATFYLDGSTLGTVAMSNGTNGVNFIFSTVGALSNGVQPCQLAIAELIVYDDAIAEDDIINIQRYLDVYYGISNVDITAFYNDYVKRGVPGAIVTRSETAIRLGFKENNKPCVILPADGALAPLGHAWTFRAWIRVTENIGNTIFGNTWGSGAYIVHGEVSAITGLCKFRLKAPGFDVSAVCITNIADGEWHLVHFTIDPMYELIKVWVDADLEAVARYKVDGINLDPGVSNSFIIGALSAIDGPYFKGDIDNVAIYSAALSDIEISNQFSKGSGRVAHVNVIVTTFASIEEPAGSFRRKGFRVGISNLSGPDLLGGVDEYNIITSETSRIIQVNGSDVLAAGKAWVSSNTQVQEFVERHVARKINQEIIGISDFIKRNIGKRNLTNETVTLSDNLVAKRGKYYSPQEIVSVTDVLKTRVAVRKSFTDTITIVENVQKLKTP